MERVPHLMQVHVDEDVEGIDQIKAALPVQYIYIWKVVANVMGKNRFLQLHTYIYMHEGKFHKSQLKHI